MVKVTLSMMEHNFTYHALKRLDDTEKVVSWKWKGLSTEKLTASTATGISLSPSIKWYKD